MGLEIERKFLVVGDDWRNQVLDSSSIRQGYIARERGNTVRVRIADDSAWITLKGATVGLARHEFEFSIGIEDAQEILNKLTAGRTLEKTRHRLRVERHLWELDEFHGANEGLLVAEIELTDEQEGFRLPDWAGEEVTMDFRYANANLVSHPYCHWD